MVSFAVVNSTISIKMQEIKLLMVFLLEILYIHNDYMKAAKDVTELKQDLIVREKQFVAATNIDGIEGNLAANKKKRTQLIREIERLRSVRDARVRKQGY